MLTTSFRWYLSRKLSFARNNLTGRVFFQSLASNSNRYENSTKDIMPNQQRKEEKLSLDFVINLFESTSKQYSAPKSHNYKEVEEEEEFDVERVNERSRGRGVEVYDTILFSEEALTKKKSSEMDYLERGYLFGNNKVEGSRSVGLLEEAIIESGSSRSMFHRVAAKAILKNKLEEMNAPTPLTLSGLLFKYISADYFSPDRELQNKEEEFNTTLPMEAKFTDSLLAELPTEYLDYVRSKVLQDLTGKDNRASALSVQRKKKSTRSYEFTAKTSEGRFVEIVRVCAVEYKEALQQLPGEYLEDELLWRKIAKLFKQTESKCGGEDESLGKKVMSASACKRKWEQIVNSAQQKE